MARAASGGGIPPIDWEGLLKRAGVAIFSHVAARATSKYMRNAGRSISASDVSSGATGFSIRPGGRSRSDNGPLRIVSGRLARSLTGAPTSGVGSREAIRNIVLRGGRLEISIGSRVPYAAVHEEGYSGMIRVPAHSRRITQAFGKPITPTMVEVRSHSKRTSIPERPYLQPALRTSDSFIRAEIDRQLINELRRN